MYEESKNKSRTHDLKCLLCKLHGSTIHITLIYSHLSLGKLNFHMTVCIRKKFLLRDTFQITKIFSSADFKKWIWKMKDIWIPFEIHFGPQARARVSRRISVPANITWIEINYIVFKHVIFFQKKRKKEKVFNQILHYFSLFYFSMWNRVKICVSTHLKKLNAVNFLFLFLFKNAFEISTFSFSIFLKHL